MASAFIEEHRTSIRKIARRHGAANVRIFGSFARSTAVEGSDVDILVSLDEGRSLLDLVSLKQELEDALGRPVDVVTERSLSPYLRSQVLSEAVAL